MTSAIQHSCNMFFYEVGYRLGLTNQMLSNAKSSESGYSSDQGCETLLKYATMFGLNQTTGIEIPESSPQVSDQDSVRSAIGQGTNNYTTTQLARYVTAIANRGTVYNLSLLDHVENKDGKVTSLVSREEFYARQSEIFVDETFHGSLPAFLAAFGSRKKLSDGEIDELQKVIDSMREDSHA